MEVVAEGEQVKARRYRNAADRVVAVLPTDPAGGLTVPESGTAWPRTTPARAG